MMNKKTSSIMASFATIKSLSDEKKYQSPFQILSEFIRYIITLDALYAFSSIEMRNKLEEHFDFLIPEAVVKTSLKKMIGVTLDNGTYYVSASEIGTDSLFEAKKQEADEYNINIIHALGEYIKTRTTETTVDNGALSQALVSFLLEDQFLMSSKYAEVVSEFVLKNEQNLDIQTGLNKIRQGSILYIGLSHNIREIGSISKRLTLYLGTEILFSLAGYNGEIYRQLANDFYEQVRLANSNGKKVITLHYFSEVKREIDEFFYTAEDIADKRKNLLIDKPAMKAILNGCCTSSDVVIKQSDFYHKLQYSYGITEDPHGSYYDEIHYANNLESSDYDEKKEEISVRLISHINKLRNGKRPLNDIDSEHLIVTNAKSTLQLSKQQTEIIKAEENLESLCNFAVSLDRITSLLWYKLGNGYQKKEFPTSINAVLKARMVLSASIAQNADKAYSDIKKQYKDGSISDAQVAARIMALREKPKLPEELQSNDIDQIMDFSVDYLSRYEEQFNGAQESLREKDRLIESIKAEAYRATSEKDVTIASQASIIQNKDDENAELRNELEKYHLKDAEIERKKNRRKNIWRFIWSIVWKVAILSILTAIAYVCESKLDTNILPYICTAVDVIGIFIIARTAIIKDKEKYLSKDEESTAIE